MAESRSKENGKTKGPKSGKKSLIQSLPLGVCLIILALALYTERNTFLPKKEAAPVQEQLTESESNGNGKKKHSIGNSVELIKKSAEDVKNFVVVRLQPPAGETVISAEDSAANNEFIEARLPQSGDSLGGRQNGEEVILGSAVLPDIKCRLADRTDLNITLSAELFYGSEVLRREISQKQAALEKTAQRTVSGIEYGTVQNNMLKLRLLNAFNNVLETGSLARVDIKNFVIE